MMCCRSRAVCAEDVGQRFLAFAGVQFGLFQAFLGLGVVGPQADGLLIMDPGLGVLVAAHGVGPEFHLVLGLRALHLLQERQFGLDRRDSGGHRGRRRGNGLHDRRRNDRGRRLDLSDRLLNGRRNDRDYHRLDFDNRLLDRLGGRPAGFSAGLAAEANFAAWSSAIAFSTFETSGL